MSQFNEVFSQLVTEQLYASQKFLGFTTSVSEYLTGKTVHIPQYNFQGAIVVNGSPVTSIAAYKPSEADLTFTVDEYSYDKPILVTNFDELLTNYNKLQVTTNGSTQFLVTQIGSRIINKLAMDVPSTKVVKTSGSNGTNNNPAKTAARKKLTYADLITLAQKMNEDNVPEDGRYLLLTPQLYTELLSDTQIINALNFGQPTLPEGVVKMVAGINIMVRSLVSHSDSSGAVYAFDAAYTPVGTDNFVGLAWQTASFVKAESAPIIYTDANNAFLRGNVLNVSYYMAAVNPRKGLDDAGVYLISQ